MNALYTDVVRVLFLDIDGVLNRTAYRPAVSVGLRSWIEPDLAANLTEALRITGAQIVLSSDWRINRELDVLREELAAATIDGTLLDVTPNIEGVPRWHQIQAWMETNGASHQDVVIIDDLYEMGPLAARFVRASPLNGLDRRAVDAIVALFGSRSPVGSD